MVFGIQILEPSGWGIVALIALAIIRGYLVPRSTVEDMRKDRDERVAEFRGLAEMWRRAYEMEHLSHRRLQEHSDLSIETARTATAALRAVAEPAEGDPDAQAVS